MEKLTRSDLYSLEQYSEIRTEFRARVLEHKRPRRVPLGPNAVLFFEDRLTMQYQIQEMLRVEKIFEAAGIEDELDAYNPLIPDGTNLKATLLIEFEDPEVRKVELGKLIGIEDQTWVQVEGFDKVYAIADEDLERETEEKTSSVHFMRFEFTPEMIAALKSGTALSLGVDHVNYTYAVSPADEPVRQALVADFD